MSIKSKFSPLGYLFPKIPQVQLTIHCNVSVDDIYLNGVSIAQNTDEVTIQVNQGLICDIRIEKSDYSTQYIEQFIIKENKTINVTIIPALEDTLYLTINSGDNGSFIIPFNQFRPVAYNWKVDWGDGSGWQYYSGTGAYNTGITYNQYEPNTEYIIKIQNNGQEKGWLNAFGFDPTLDGVGPSSLFNKNKLILVDGALNNDMFFKDSESEPINYLFSYMFIDCKNLKIGNSFNLPQNMPKTSDNMFLRMFQNCISLDSLENITLTLSINEVKNQFCYAMFMGCIALNDLNNFNLPQNITKCGEYFCTAMFRDCTALESLNNFNLPPNLIDIAICPFTYMFYNCTSLNDLNNFNFPQNIINAPAFSFAYYTFAYCSSLETLGIMKMPNIKSINNNIIINLGDTNQLLNYTHGYFEGTFMNCTSLKTGIISFLSNWTNVTQALVDYYFIYRKKEKTIFATVWRAVYCYYVLEDTFKNCTSLQETLTQNIKVLAFMPETRRHTFEGCPDAYISTLNANWK